MIPLIITAVRLIDTIVNCIHLWCVRDFFLKRKTIFKFLFEIARGRATDVTILNNVLFWSCRLRVIMIISVIIVDDESYDLTMIFIRIECRFKAVFHGIWKKKFLFLCGKLEFRLYLPLDGHVARNRTRWLCRDKMLIFCRDIVKEIWGNWRCLVSRGLDL